MAVSQSTSDPAKSRHRDQWLHHPLVGDPSWDSFQREPGNPVYIGKEPYLWPVNGFLWPVSARLLANHWQPARMGGQPARRCGQAGAAGGTAHSS